MITYSVIARFKDGFGAPLGSGYSSIDDAVLETSDDPYAKMAKVIEIWRHTPDSKPVIAWDYIVYDQRKSIS